MSRNIHNGISGAFNLQDEDLIDIVSQIGAFIVCGKEEGGIDDRLVTDFVVDTFQKDPMKLAAACLMLGRIGQEHHVYHEFGISDERTSLMQSFFNFDATGWTREEIVEEIRDRFRKDLNKNIKESKEDDEWDYNF